MYKIYVIGNYFYIERLSDSFLFEGLAKDVRVRKKLTTSTDYYFENVNGWEVAKAINLTDIQDQGGAPYTQPNFETFYQDNTGKSSGGGNGSGVASVTGHNVDNTDAQNPVILDKYQERFDSFTAGVSNTWVTVVIPGAPVNQTVTIMAAVTSNNTTIGVDRQGGVLPRAERIDTDSTINLTVKTNASGEIDVFTSDNGNTTFYVVDYLN